MNKMNKKTLLVKNIKELTDGPNGEKRFSLRENGEHFCIAVVPAGDEERLAEVKGLKGKEVIAIEREVTTGEDVAVLQWYLLTDEDVDSYATREAKRDVGAVIAAKKAEAEAQVKLSLAEVMKKAGAQSVAA